MCLDHLPESFVSVTLDSCNKDVGRIENLKYFQIMVKVEHDWLAGGK